MGDQQARGADRRLAWAMVVSFVLGAACVSFAIWGIRHPGPHVPFGGAPPEMRLAAGPIFIGFGVAELVHRLRHGPQQPGRHTRSSSTE